MMYKPFYAFRNFLLCNILRVSNINHNLCISYNLLPLPSRKRNDILATNDGYPQFCFLGILLHNCALLPYDDSREGPSGPEKVGNTITTGAGYGKRSTQDPEFEDCSEGG